MFEAGQLAAAMPWRGTRWQRKRRKLTYLPGRAWRDLPGGPVGPSCGANPWSKGFKLCFMMGPGVDKLPSVYLLRRIRFRELGNLEFCNAAAESVQRVRSLHIPSRPSAWMDGGLWLVMVVMMLG